jgi:SAM-dependent methyltransferase
MDVISHNREAWNRWVDQGNPWTVPVSPEEIAAARQGDWSIFLTETKPVPKEWLPPLEGLQVLCLASGGGQQGPILAAAGAAVTVFDLSPKQLGQDRMVAEREGLPLRLVEGDMRDLSVFEDESFDLIVHPVSNVFSPDIRPVWREAYRVLRPGGYLIAAFVNPVEYIFDSKLLDEQGEFRVRHALPYSDEDLTEEEWREQFGEHAPIEYSHTLEDQIGGQLDAGFIIVGLYEDYRRGDEPIAQVMPSYIATRARKPAR